MEWKRTEEREELKKLTSLGGGCIASLVKCQGKKSGKTYVLKTNPTKAMNEAEMRGLEELARCAEVRVPQVVAYGEDSLLLEFIPSKRASDRDQLALGKMVARLHSCRGESFGLSHDNFIGETPQINTPFSRWADFFWECRLGPQWQWAREKGFSSRLREEELQNVVERFLGEKLEAEQDVFPSLLHGDLWSANWMASDQGVFLIDPAAFYGHWEMEFAMIHLFGGFSPAFFESYQKEFGADLETSGFHQRQKLYRSYHLLNHYNLFGGHYGRKAEEELDNLLKLQDS